MSNVSWSLTCIFFHLSREINSSFHFFAMAVIQAFFLDIIGIDGFLLSPVFLLPLVYTQTLISWLRLSSHPSPTDYLLFWCLRLEKIDGPELKTGQDWWLWGRSMYGKLLEEFSWEVYQYQWQWVTYKILSLSCHWSNASGPAPRMLVDKTSVV